MKPADTPATTTNQAVLAPLPVVPPGNEGENRGSCASCGLYLWSEGGYRVPGLQGLFCSLLCMGCAVADRTRRTRKISGTPIGNGAGLLAYLKTEAPHVYASIAESIPTLRSTRCLECGVSLDGKRSDSEFCSDAHSKRYRRRKQSQMPQKCGISPDMPIGEQELTGLKTSHAINTPSQPTQPLQTTFAQHPSALGGAAREPGESE
jgi:hypothetical protein